MKKPRSIGLLSLVPGLGFIVLGKTLPGLGTAALVVFPVIVALLVPWEDVAIALITIALIAWVSQWYLALDLAKRRARAEAGDDLVVREISSAPLPPKASAGEKLLHRARQTVMALLEPEEHLSVALEGRTGTMPLVELLVDGPSAPLDVRVVYLGATEQDLVLVKTDRLGKPSELERIPLDQVTVVNVKEGLLVDQLVMRTGETEPLEVELPRSSREATRRLAKILAKSVS